MSGMTPDEFLMGGGGAPSAKFEAPGTTVRGKITDLQVRQQTDVRTREPLTWPSGDPKMQLLVTVQTDQRDPSIEDDDGERRIYVKGKRLTDATRDAVKAVGAKGLEVGGTVAVTYVRDGTPAGPGISAPKEYAVVYQRPNASAAFLGTAQSEGVVHGNQTPTLPAAPAAAPQPATAAPEDALQAALANLSPEVKAALLAQAKAG